MKHLSPTAAPFARRKRGAFSASDAFRSGFSLVEVTLAIGVIAFAFVALLGLLPVGLRTFHTAMDTSVGSQIAQRVAGELQETDYFTLLKSCSPDLSKFQDDDGQVGSLPRRFFDDQGSEIRVSSSGNPSSEERRKILYEVFVRVSRAKAVPTTEGSRPARLGSRNLATLTIQVVNNPSGSTIPLTDELLVDPLAVRGSVQTFPAMIARNTATP
jgi:uncharacterized protein (TIGR02598 family)